jgi:MurNAc alpha-1-phosphate uridylyltransferase
MILAAGRGERMRPISDRTPKPLLEVHGKPLIEWHLEALARAGVERVVINTAWLEDQIVARVGDGSRWGLDVHYSLEGRDHGGALETAGGIAKALPLLGPCFWLVSADIYAPDFAFDPSAAGAFARGGEAAHLWLVPNPPFHPRGDFGLDAEGFGIADPAGPTAGAGPTPTWRSAGRSSARALLPGTVAPLGPLLFAAMRERRITAEVYAGRWENIGTPEQLAAANASRSPPPAM